MSPTALRWLAIPLGLAAFAGHLAITLWLQPRTFHTNFGLALAVLGAATAFLIGVIAGLFALLVGRRRPAVLVQRKGKALVETSPAYAGGQAMLWMFFAGMGPPRSGRPAAADP